MEVKELMREIFLQNGYNLINGMENEEVIMDSLQFISIICDIEDVFDLELPNEYLSGDKLVYFNDYISLVQRIKEDDIENV